MEPPGRAGVGPRIQYTKTSDGVNIAYWTLGEGKPMVWLPGFLSHAQLGWEMPELRRSYERLAEGRRLVGYDHRGAGLSDRDVADFSLDALTLDLEAVVDHLELKTFALVGVGGSGTAAVAFAARHPERVTKLILVGAFATVPDTAANMAMRQLLESSDWELYTETLAHYFLGLAEGQAMQRLAAYLRECMTQQALLAMTGQLVGTDVSNVLPQVESPALVIHPRASRYVPLDAARHLASRIPNARLVVVEGDSVVSNAVWETVVTAIDDFLAEGEEDVSGAKQPAPAFRTILFTDIEGSTALTERLGDARAQELRRAHDTIVREALKGCGGSETKHTGDGIMASFLSASRAIECAVAVQRAIAEREDATLRVRIGLNAGEPVAEEADLFGTAVNLARRICDRAEPGQILVSDVVHQLAAGKGFRFADNGEATLKGFEKPVRLHEVRWRDE